MKYKNTAFLFFIMLMVSILPLVHAEESTDIADEGYILDQMQTLDWFYVAITQGEPAAQSFQPTISPLAKVRLLVRFEGDIVPGPNQQVKVSIKEYLDGEDLTSVMIPASEIGAESSWVNFDFDDITVTIDGTYYMVFESFTNQGEFRWFCVQDINEDHYDRGTGWLLDTSGNVVSWEEFPEYTDFCFKTFSYAGKIPDLECNTIVFGWPEQIPGGTISDIIRIKNVGDSRSLLNWEIASYPEWGNWTFDPMSGVDLEPEDGLFTIDVTVEIPNEQNQDYTGEIVIVNSLDETDTESIAVSMTTEKTRIPRWFSYLPLFLQRLIEEWFPFF